MKKSTKISLSLAVAVLVIGGFFMKKSSKNEGASKVAETLIEKMQHSLPYPKDNGESTKSSVALAKKELPENPYLAQESFKLLPKEMQDFLILDMKSIRNEEETKSYYSLLRSSEVLLNAQKILLTSSSEREHMVATRLLGRALGDLNNKSNKALHEIVKRVILEENLSGNISYESKLLFAGDKGELAQNYIAFNPNGHKELLERAKSPMIKKIIENAYAYNLSMRTQN